jgi:hypothetical protein
MLIKSKQIDRLIQGPVFVTGFAATAASSNVVTTAVTSAATTAGDLGTAVTVAAATTTTAGFITTGNNLVEIYNATTGAKIASAAGNEVYGRLTEAAGVYTLNYYTNVAGVETAYTFGSATNIDFNALYLYTFEKFPRDGITGTSVRHVADDPKSSGSIKTEKLTISGANAFSAMATAPDTAQPMALFINGQMLSSLESSPAFSVTGTAITFNSTNAGFSIATTDIAIIQYQI